MSAALAPSAAATLPSIPSTFTSFTSALAGASTPMAKIAPPCGSATNSTPGGPNAIGPADFRSGLPVSFKPASAARPVAASAKAATDDPNIVQNRVMSDSPTKSLELGNPAAPAAQRTVIVPHKRRQATIGGSPLAPL